MFSNILRFSILSVFCVFTAISSVYAHNANSITDWGNYCHDHGGRRHCHKDARHRHVEGNDLHVHWNPNYNHQAEHDSNSANIVWIRKPDTTVHPDWYNQDTDLYHEHGSGWHYHRNVKKADGTLKDDFADKHSGTTGTTRVIERKVENDVQIDIVEVIPDDADHDNTGAPPTGTGYVAGPDPVEEDTNEWHSHTFTAHQHGTYASHSHTVRHKHSSITNPHPHPNPHYLDNDHSNVGTQSVVQGAAVQGAAVQGAAVQGAAVQGAAVNQQSAPQEAAPVVSITRPQQNPIITEYMLRDYSRSGGAGLPQWVEIYNPNAGAMELRGYQFTYAERNTANSPYRYKTKTIDSFIIPAGQAKIIVGKKIEARLNTVAGLSAEDIWVIPSQENWVSLKDGWHLADPSGKAIYRIGGAFEEKPAAAAWDDSIAWRGNVRVPPHTSEGFRVSYQSLPSESPDEDHFYGNVEDSGAVAVVVNSKTTYAFVGKSSPGFYRPVSVAPAAPSLVRPKRIGTWAGLKK